MISEPDYTISVWARSPAHALAEARVTDRSTGTTFVGTSSASTEAAVLSAFSMARAGGMPEYQRVIDALNQPEHDLIFCVLPADQAFGPSCPPEIRSCILIAEASYWKEHGCLDDHHIGGKLPRSARHYITEVMESVFESHKEPDEIRRDLEYFGLRFSESMQSKNDTAYFW